MTSSVAALLDGRTRHLTPAETKVAAVVAAGVGVLGLIGFANSFAAVQAAAVDSFGRMAWTVPLGIDIGIAVFSALDIVLARLDMRLPWLRLVPWSLTAATVYLNVARAGDAFGVVAHAAGPALWVLAVEVGAHVARVRAGIASGRRMDRVRTSRWVLAPLATARLWRRMVLWEVRSYPDALGRERDRVLALTDLQDRHGWFSWRWRAPRRDRALYRLGELVPADPAAPVVPAVPEALAPPVPVISAPVVLPEDHAEDHGQDHGQDHGPPAGPGLDEGQSQDHTEVRQDHDAERPDQSQVQEPVKDLRPGTDAELTALAAAFVADCRRAHRNPVDRRLVEVAHAQGLALGRKRARSLIGAVTTPHAVRDAGAARPLVLLAVVVAAGFVLGALGGAVVTALVLAGAVVPLLVVVAVVATLRRQAGENQVRESRLHWVEVPVDAAKDRS